MSEQITFTYRDNRVWGSPTRGSVTLNLPELLPCPVSKLKTLEKKFFQFADDSDSIYSQMKDYLAEDAGVDDGAIRGFLNREQELKDLARSLQPDIDKLELLLGRMRGFAVTKKQKEVEKDAKNTLKDFKKRQKEYTNRAKLNHTAAEDLVKKRALAKEDIEYLDEVDGTWQTLLS